VTVNKQATAPLVQQLTVVVPMKKKEPEGGTHNTVPQRPLVAGAKYVTTAPHWPKSVGMLISARHEMSLQGSGAPTTGTQGENSDVLPAESVAVAVMNRPSATDTGNVTMKLLLQLASVVTFAKPRNVSPSPYPLESQETLAKNSRRNVVFAALLIVPDTLSPSVFVAALVSESSQVDT